MRPPLLWRIVEWQLGRHLQGDHLVSALGDLAEDHARQVARLGRWRADLWLLREGLSVAAAYRARDAGERRASQRTILGGGWLDEAGFALRRVRRQPATSAASILTLGCAIAAGAVAWSLLSALLLRPLPVADPERLMAIGVERTSVDGAGARTLTQSRVFGYKEYLALRESGAFSGLAAGGSRSLRVSDSDDLSARQRLVYFASYDYFTTLGAPLPIGRPFTPAEDQRGAPLVAVLSERYWRSAWNADPAIVGRTLTVLEQPATIVGVAPRGFRGLNLAEAPDLYLPFHAIGDAGPSLGNPAANFFDEPVSFEPPLRESSTWWIRIVGRLQPGDSVEQASSRVAALYGATVLMTPVNVAAIPEVLGAGMVPFARLLSGTVALLVLIGCLTVAVLLLVRTESRRDELAMCLALGGTRAGLARGIVFEAALLTAAGVVLAWPIASALFRGIRAFELPGRVAIEHLDLALDRSVWLALGWGAVFALVLMTLVAVIVGFAPQAADVLRARAGGTAPVTRRRLRAALVSAQVAVALVLLVGAGLFARSLSSALTLNTGFDAGRIVTGTVSLLPYGYTAEQAPVFFDDLRERLRRKPDVESISLIVRMGGMGPGGVMRVNGVPRQFPTPVADVAVDDQYFTTLGQSTVEGRAFSVHDTVDAAPVVIVSESFGRALAGGGSPIGYRITDRIALDSTPTVREVVGVVPDVITNVAVTEPLVVYYPAAQHRFARQPQRTIVMRARADAAPVVRAAMSAVRAIDPRVEPGPLLTIEAQLAQQMPAQQLGRFVLGALGGIALLLTMLGAYVLAESLSSGRRRELGIHAALGAGRLRLGGLVLAETGRLVGVGLAAGLLLAWLGAGTIQAFLFRVEPLDLATLATVAAAILAVSIAVSLRPAIAAAHVDPARTLHTE